MKTLAKKSVGVGALYAVCLIIGIAFCISSFSIIYMLFFGIPLVAVSLYIVIEYFLTPMEPIKLNNENELVLPKGVIIPLSDINDVSYRRASARGIQYKWGTVKIISLKGTFKFRYLENCEEVCKEITKLMYESKAQK